MKEAYMNNSKRRYFFERKQLVWFLVIFLLLCICNFIASTKSKEYTTYECDVKVLALATEIEIEREGKDFATVKGNFFRIVEDPLTMYDLKNRKVAYASDTYHFISQDSHGIFVNGSLEIEMAGKFALFGNSYKLYNSEGKYIGKASFNLWNTSGKIVNEDGKLVAKYTSGFFRKDFKVKIYEDGFDIDDRAILMLFSSYYSDQNFDNQAASKK